MLDPLEVLLLALLGVPATALLLWLAWSRLLANTELSFGQSALIGLLATALVGGGIYFADPEVPLQGLLLGLALGFFIAALGVDYADEWGPPIRPYALGCAPLSLVAALVLAVFLLGGPLPHLVHTVLLGGLGGPAFGLLFGLAWLRWGPRGPMGCLPLVLIGAIAAIAVGGLDWYYSEWYFDEFDDDWAHNGGPSPFELIGSSAIGGLLAIVTVGFLDRYRPPEEPIAIGCMPPLGIVGLVSLALILTMQNLFVLDPVGPQATPRPVTTATPAVGTPAAGVTPTPVAASTPTPAAVATPTPAVATPTPVATATPVPAAERTDFIDALIEWGLDVSTGPFGSPVDLAMLPDAPGDLFKADGGPVTVTNPVDIQAGFVLKFPDPDQEFNARLFGACGLTEGQFRVLCGQQQDGVGPVNIIWYSMYEPIGQITGGPFVIADTDTNTQNNPQPNAQFPLAPSRGGNLQFSPVTQGANTAVRVYDFDRPGEFRQTDAVVIYGMQSVGWIVFGEYGTFTPGVEVIEGNPLDANFAVDVLGPLPVAGQSYPAIVPYDVTQPCGALCQP